MPGAQADETVIGEIQSLIRSKKESVGDRMEGERSLAERLRVSGTSVRKGLRVLGAMCIIRS